MEASSNAYPQASLYRRTSAIVDHGQGRNYVVDVFRVQGGTKQDYVFHASATTCAIAGLTLEPAPTEKLYDFSRVRTADGAAVWRATWSASPDMTAIAWSVGQPGERVLVADGWGQRDWKNSDLGATLPYVVRRTTGDAMKTFITVYEGHRTTDLSGPFVRSVAFDPATGLLAIETVVGTDYILSHTDAGTLTVPGLGVRETGEHPLTGRFVVASTSKGKLAWSFTAAPGR
jgi:hypothetical protein